MKITDNFIFKVLTGVQARSIFYRVTDLELFALHEDGTEALITARIQMDECFKKGIPIGIQVGAINPAQLFQDEAQRIADKFRANIAEIVPKEDRARIDYKNTVYRTAERRGTCETHSYCDANVPMSEAFTAITGREIELQNQPDVHLWNRAWEIAAVDGFAKI